MKSSYSGLDNLKNGIRFLNYRLMNRQKSRKFLSDWLNSFPGVSAKVSQIIDDKLEEFDTHEKRSIDYSMPFDEIKDQINGHLEGFSDKIKVIEEEAHLASIGQVHKLTTDSGKQYALKVQYKGINSIITRQIDSLFKFYKFIPFKNKEKFSKEDYKDLLEDILKKETDYLQESRRQHLFYEYFKDCRIKVIVPKVYLDHCSKRILMQDWVDSLPVNSYANKGKSERLQAASTLFTSFLEMLFGLKVLQTDFNFGNIGFKLDNRGNFAAVVLYDFGATLSLEENHAAIMWQLLKAAINEDTFSSFDMLVGLGFDGNKLKYIAHVLPAVVNLMVEPLLVDRPFSMSDWNLKERLNNILGEDKWWFRFAGPPWFFLFLKAINGLFTLIKKLDVKVNYYQIYQDFKQQGCLIDSVQVDIPKDQHIRFNIKNFTSMDCAKYLNIKLNESGKAKVDLQMPCHVVDMIDEVIPHEYAGNLASKNIDLKKIREKVQKSGYVKQELITESFGDQELKIWLS